MDITQTRRPPRYYVCIARAGMALRRGQIHADKAQDFAAPSPQSGATSEADSDPIDQVSDTTDAHRSDITDYEDLRRRNMARNAAFLASVGLLPPATDLPGSNARYAAKPVKRSRREVVAAQARAGAEEAVTGDATPSLLLRRSTRVATLPNAPNYAEPRTEEPRESQYRGLVNARFSSMRAINDVWASGTSGIKAESSTGASARDGEEGGVSLSARRADEPTGHEAEASSGRRSRDMYANVAYFLSEGVLGVRLREATKAPVMALAAGGESARCPAFNRCSGVAEWRNSIFLWVNVPSSSSSAEEYPNEFFEDGRYMSWFGGSRMHADSAIVQRLLSAGSGKDDSKKSRGGSCVVLLMVRVDTEPYTCLGRVRAQSADLERHPVAVRWELLDRHRLSLTHGSLTSDVDAAGAGAERKGESDFGRILRLVAKQSASRKK